MRTDRDISLSNLQTVEFAPPTHTPRAASHLAGKLHLFRSALYEEIRLHQNSQRVNEAASAWSCPGAWSAIATGLKKGCAIEC